MQILSSALVWVAHHTMHCVSGQKTSNLYFKVMKLELAIIGFNIFQFASTVLDVSKPKALDKVWTLLCIWMFHFFNCWLKNRWVTFKSSWNHTFWDFLPEYLIIWWGTSDDLLHWVRDSMWHIYYIYQSSPLFTYLIIYIHSLWV